MTSVPDVIETEYTLATAVARFDELRNRAALASTAEDMAAEAGDGIPSLPPLAQNEALELLALGEVIARKAGYGRQLDVRAARRAGASWSLIGAALGTSKQSAWEAHNRWIDLQAERRARGDVHDGLSPEDVAAERRLAGDPED
jgi:hypothetical protein